MAEKKQKKPSLGESVVREEVNRAPNASKKQMKTRLMAKYPTHGGIPMLVNKIFREKAASTPQAGVLLPMIQQPITAPKTGAENANLAQRTYTSPPSQLPSPITTGGKKVPKGLREASEDRKIPITNKVSPKAPSNPKVQELTAYIHSLDGSKKSNPNAADVGSIIQMPVLERQLPLLHLNDGSKDTLSGDLPANAAKEAILFSADLSKSIDSSVIPQYALLGGSVTGSPGSSEDPRIFLNTNIPFSAFICGVQGSGKSHTTSCLIENCLIRSPALGALRKPLSALVLHFGEYSSNLNFRPSEAAFLASPGEAPHSSSSPLSVTVLASPSNYKNLRSLYSQIPNVEVQPFKLRSGDLDIRAMLDLMSVDQTKSRPLYMGAVTKILRDMAAEIEGGFDYLEFRQRLRHVSFDRVQEEFLNQRLDLLESFLDLDGEVPSTLFSAGRITIIDLTCPFMDSNTACVLFKIGVSMYLGSDMETGKVIVVDEAHKYMTDTPAAKELTECFLAVIRQQRHYGARVIISTQEPTISPRLIDLCSITIVHRFSSPDWFNILRQHIIVTAGRNGADAEMAELFQQISGLRTGEALVFAPSAILGGNGNFAKMADKTFRMMVRKRITWDGGRSLVCV